MEKKRYIAYGSNINLEQMAWRCPTAKTIGTAILEGYELLFRGGNGGAVATIEKKEDGAVPVLVWELEPRDEAALDSYEGWPTFYRKETVKVRIGNEWTDVMVYIMNDGRQLGKPGNRYYDIIRDGYEAVGFEIEILNQAVKNSSGR